MNEIPPNSQPPPDALAALAALQRARKRAERLAAMTGTPLVQTVDGKVVLTYPPLESLDDADET